jgi:ATP phosphoribosyltransferase
MSNKLLLAVPKKGRLYEKVKDLLAGSGIEYNRQERLDIAHCPDLPVALVFLPAADIATYVGEGGVDMGITGEDMMAECQAEVDVLMKLSFGKCNLSVQAPVSANITSVEELAGKRIVTSFPNVTRKFFASLESPGKETSIKCISGSVEAACGLGLADAVVDLVETGTTMRAAGLEEVAVVMQTETVLIANPRTRHPDLVDLVRKRISGYLTAQAWCMVAYNVHRSGLHRVIQISPGIRSPCITPLDETGWVEVQACVLKKEAHSIMDQLQSAGAKDILLTQFLSTRF